MRKIREFFNALSDAQQAVITIVGVVVVVTGGWATVLQWLENLNIFSKIFYSVAVFGLIFIFMIAFVTWWRKHDVDNIPMLLCQLDDMLRKYVQDFNIKAVATDDAIAIGNDLGEYLKVDVSRIDYQIR